ncbi:MAG TPA: hypothetical protein HA346_06390 [Thermoplasmata archaeon]|nr:hypothetical protein [Thermoplasmata archaeon]
MKDTLINQLKFAFYPDEFFSAKSKEPARWSKPFLIVFINGVLASIMLGYGAYRLLPYFLKGLTPSTSAFLGVVAGLLGAPLAWYLAGLLTFVLSLLFKKGDEDLSKVLEFLGYGTFPLIFAGLFSLPLVFRVLNDPGIYSYLEGAYFTDFSTILEYVKPVIQIIVMRPSAALVAVIGLLFTYWTVYLLIFGIKNARNLSMEKTLTFLLFIVGIVTVVSGGVIAAII